MSEVEIKNFFLVFLFAILLVVEILQLYRQAFLKKSASRFFLYSSGAIFVYLIYIAFLQFKAFQSGPLGLTLGSKDGISWFFGYVSTHFWNQYLVSLPVALLFAFIAYYFNKKYNGRFFEREELWLAALGILLVGYPGFLFYIAAMLILPALISAIFVRRGERFPLYHLWVPVAIVVFLSANLWAVNQPWWKLFIF